MYKFNIVKKAKNMPPFANWSYPTAIRFGPGRISEIAEACIIAEIKKPLLITDRGLAKLEITARTLNLLDAAGLGRAIFAEVDTNPNEKNANAGPRIITQFIKILNCSFMR